MIETCRHEWDDNGTGIYEKAKCMKCGLAFKDYHIPWDPTYTCKKCGKTFTSGHECKARYVGTLAHAILGKGKWVVEEE
jgi:hypothetical protein